MTNKFIDYNLAPELLQAITDCGYVSCTEIQSKTIPYLLEDNDCLIQSKTGSGKTAAFCIPLIQKISFNDPTRALILVPTRELAKQIQHEFNRLSLYKKINCVCCIGREDFQKQALQLKQKAHVIVGTPGRIQDHLDAENIDLSNVDTFILDEASEMFSLGLLEQVQEIHSFLYEHKTWLFSATLGDTSEYKLLGIENPIHIEMDSSEEIADEIETYHISTNEKFKTLLRLLNTVTIESCCVFINTREDVENIAKQCKEEGFLVSMIHGGLEQKERNRALKAFKEGKTRILVTTDISARGIDVDRVSLVVHYDCPLTIDSYIHRSGRTGRNEQSGLSITLLSNNDRSSIFRTIEEETDEFTIPSKKIDNKLHRTLIKTDKDEVFNKKNCTLFIRAGKKDKIRNLDIVGSLCSLAEIEGDNIGIIDIQDTYATVTLLNIDATFLNAFDSIKIKGKNRKIELKNR